MSSDPNESLIDPRPGVSVVVPTYNEQDSLCQLHEGISGELTDATASYEIIFVDDGSGDQSWCRIRELADRDPRTRGLKLRRNFGKADALEAGIALARYDIVITMDADLQDDPTEISRFLAKLDEGFDVVSGWKKVRHDPWHKVWPSRVFNSLVSRMTGVRLHDHNCGFKAYRRGVFDDVRLYGERHRFIPVLAAAKGWRVGELVVEHHARPFGQSKYGVSRLLKGFLDLLTIYFITGFGKRPLHLIGSAGVVCFALGGLGMAYLTVRWVVSRMTDAIDVLHLHETAIFYYCILAILLGSQFMLAGLLAELFVSLHSAQRSPASVETAIGAGGEVNPASDAET